MKTKYLIIGVIAVILDQFTKYMITTNMELHQEITIIDNFFSLFYIRNSGAAFSILEGQTIFFYIATIVGLIMVYFIFKTSKTQIQLLASAFLFGGIMGNFIDRILYQEVIDFLKFTIFNRDAAIFNFADAFITISVILFVLDMFITNKEQNNANNS